MTGPDCLFVWSLGCIFLSLSLVCAVIAFLRGEWDIKRTNDALNDDADVFSAVEGGRAFHFDSASNSAGRQDHV